MLISEDNVKRGNWPLAIVEEIYQGKDGLVRTATLQTKMGKRRRSVQKLYLLEEAHSVEESLQNSEPIQSQSLPRISTGMRHATKVHTPGDKGKRNSTNNKDLDSLPIPVGSIAQLVERRSRNPKMRVQIPLETTNFSLSFAVSD